MQRLTHLAFYKSLLFYQGLEYPSTFGSLQDSGVKDIDLSNTPILYQNIQLTERWGLT